MPENKSEQSSVSSGSVSRVKKASTTNEGKDDLLPKAKSKAVEVGGRKGLDPVRYGDWEKGGRCIDF